MKKMLAIILSSTILLSMLQGLSLTVGANGTTYTTFSNCDTNWTHFELESTNFKEGSGALGITLDPNQVRPLQTGIGANRFMQITSQNINLTDATGGLGMWVWIDNNVSFNFGDIQLTSSENSDTDAYYWNMSQWKDRLNPGWTWLSLKFSDAQKFGNPNPNALNFMRLFVVHNSIEAKRFLLDDMRLINVTDASNIIAPNQVTTFSSCDTNWTHFELESTNFKEGSAATGITLDPGQIRPLQSGNGSDHFMQITSENINLSDATGALGMWVWIDSDVIFNFGDIQLTSSENSDTDAYVWNMVQWKDRLSPGWTWLILKFSDAQKIGSPNPNSLNFMRLFIAHNSLTAKRFLVDDMRLMNIKDNTNLIAPKQVTSFNNCDTNWTHFEVETANYKEGSASVGITLEPNQIRPLQSGNGADHFMQIISENINLSDATGGVGMWVWIDSDVVFSFGDIQLTSGENSDTDAYIWNLDLWKNRLNPGWTWLTLNFSDAQKIGNPNPNGLNFMRIFIAHNSVVTKRFLVDDIRLIHVKDSTNLVPPTYISTVNLNSYIVKNVEAIGNVLTNIQPETSVSVLKANINPQNGASIIIRNKQGDNITHTNDAFISTGTTLEININSTATTYTAVIYGDVDNDGKIELSDLVIVRNTLLEIETLSTSDKLAGDIYGEQNITLNSLVGLMAKISENGTILQNR